MRVFDLKHPELLLVENGRGARMVGSSQYWYPKTGFMPRGACGAAVASNALGYLLRSRPDLYDIAAEKEPLGLAAPLSDKANIRTDYVEFMKKVYPFFLPRAGGLMSDSFVEGIAALSLKYGLPLEAECLRVPISRSKRPSKDEVACFIRASFESDTPVCFLILSPGRANGLDTWHWVTILAFDGESMRAKIVDNCNIFWTDIGAWLATSIMGGSLVRLQNP